MAEAETALNSVDELTEEFARSACATASGPRSTEYVARFPQWADEIREYVPGRRDDGATQAAMREFGSTGPPSPVPRRPSASANIASFARSAAAGWAWSTRPNRKRCPPRRHQGAAGDLLADDKLRLRFRRESQAAARLHHTNIVPGLRRGRGQRLLLLRDAAHPRPRTGRASSGTPRRTRRSFPRLQPRTQARAIHLSPTGGQLDRTTRLPNRRRSPHAELEPRDFCRAVAQIGVQVAEALAVRPLPRGSFTAISSPRISCSTTRGSLGDGFRCRQARRGGEPHAIG